MNRLRREEGQVMVLVAAILVGIIGMTAFVVDVGAWFRQQRALQSTVDAAALAGAQALPTDPGSALNLAIDYGAKNGGTGAISSSDVTLKSTYTTSSATPDTIVVGKAQPGDSFFGKLLGVFSVTVHARATAMAGVPTEAQYVAPIAVRITHPDLTGQACGQQNLTDPTARICFGPLNPTSLPLGKTGAPGAFDLINLDPTQQNGTVGASTLATWIQNGYDKYLPLGGYFSDPGAKYNGSEIDNALAARTGTDLLFPVYDTLSGTGSNASYHVIAWVGFHLMPGSYLQGSSGLLNGYFTKVLWQGILPAGGPATNPNLGVTTVSLVN
jgi:Flp pilus assembly protein TadG